MRSVDRGLVLALQALTAGGVALALVNYGTLRSLWLDEAMLALNLAERSFAGLTAPLDLLQAAPIGFLWLEKGAIAAFGDRDWALRLVPLLAYLAAVPLCYAFATRMLSTRRQAWLATAVFANAYAANYYATEVKQYMLDATLSVAIVLACLRFAERRTLGTALALGAFGVACLWLSHVAVVMLFTTGLYLLYEAWTDSPRDFRLTVLPVVLWLVNFLVYYQAFIHDNPNGPGMVAYWEPFGVFLPHDPTGVAFWEQLWGKVQVTAKLVCQYRRFSLPLFTFVVLGVWAFAKTNRPAFFVLAAPFGVHLAMAYLRLYPFEMRMVLYLLPAVVVFLAAGVAVAFGYLRVYLPRAPALAVALVPLLLFGLNVRTVGLEVEEVKDALDYLDAEAEAGDRVYVYFQSSAAVQFYLREHYPELARRATFVYGVDGKEDWEVYAEHLRAQEGIDYLVFTGPPGLLEAEGYGLMDYFVCVAREGGLAVAEARHFVGSSVFWMRGRGESLSAEGGGGER